MREGNYVNTCCSRSVTRWECWRMIRCHEDCCCRVGPSMTNKLNPEYRISKEPIGFGNERFVVRWNDIRIGTADNEEKAQIIAVVHELTHPRKP